VNHFAGPRGQPRSFVDTHAPHGHAWYPCSSASISTRANVASVVGPGPRRAWRDTGIQDHWWRCGVHEDHRNAKGTPPGIRAEAAVIFAKPRLSPPSGLTRSGFTENVALGERDDPDRPCSVNGARRSRPLWASLESRHTARTRSWGSAPSTRTPSRGMHSERSDAVDQAAGPSPPPGTVRSRRRRVASNSDHMTARIPGIGR
jgi:hypothetical protein